MTSITSQIFKHFTTLKLAIFSSNIKPFEEAFCNLIQVCKNVEKVVLYYCTDNEIKNIIKCVGKLLRQRTNNLPLTIRSKQCIARISPNRSSKYSMRYSKLFFEIYDINSIGDINKHKPIFTTEDNDTFIKQIELLMNCRQ